MRFILFFNDVNQGERVWSVLPRVGDWVYLNVNTRGVVSSVEFHDRPYAPSSLEIIVNVRS